MATIWYTRPATHAKRRSMLSRHGCTLQDDRFPWGPEVGPSVPSGRRAAIASDGVTAGGRHWPPYCEPPSWSGVVPLPLWPARSPSLKRARRSIRSWAPYSKSVSPQFSVKRRVPMVHST